MELFDRQFKAQLGLGEEEVNSIEAESDRLFRGDRFDFIFSGNKHLDGLNSGTKSLSQLVGEAWNRAEYSLHEFATSPNFRTQMQVAFGNGFDVGEASQFSASWLKGEFGNFPSFEIRDAAEINGANGAFAAAMNTIYLSREFVSQNAGNLDAATDVLLEEYGHYIDSRINKTDTGGDEGEIFKALVRGEGLSAAELEVLKGEDDSAIVLLDGKEVAIEQQIKSEILNFSANNIEGWNNLVLPRSDQTLFETGNALNQSGTVDSLGFKFNWNIDASAKINLFAEWGGLGILEEFKYPVKLDVNIPTEIENNERLVINTSSFKLENSLIKGSGFELPGAGIDLLYDLKPSGIKDISFTHPFGTEKISDISLFETPISDKKELFRVRLGDVGFNFPVGNLGSVSFTPPDNIAVQTASVYPDFLSFIPASANPKLQPIAGTGTDDLAKVTADLDGILAFFFPPARLLKFPPIKFGGTVTDPSSGEQVEFSPQEFEIIKKFNPDRITNSDREFVTKYDLTFEDLQALKELQLKERIITRYELENITEKPAENITEKPAENITEKPAENITEKPAENIAEKPAENIAEKPAENIAEKPKRFTFDASLDLLDVTLNFSSVLRQDFVFSPANVSVQMEVVGDSRQTQTGNLGDLFDFTSPASGSGLMEIKATYKLSGSLFNEIGLALQGSLDAEILKYQLAAKYKNFEFLPLRGGPLFKAQYPEGGYTTKPLPIAGSNPDAPLKIAALDIQSIGEEDVNKDLVIEKIYKIPYGVPLSISDAASVTEGTEETNAGASRQSQAYFTYNGKYYEWQPRIIQPFTGSGGDVLSRISLETLGDASPNAYNFIAFQNNIPDPNLIIAGTTIQVPKEVPLPDTTGYAVFEVSSSGGSAKTNYNTADGTATAGSDYLAASGTLSIPGGQGGVILVPIVPDTEQEETETFKITLTRSDGTPISEGVDKREATGTINDDDKKPDSPENKAATYNDPRIVTFDGQYHDFQAAGEFTLINTLSDDIKIQVRQQPVGNNPTSNVTDNTAVATQLGGKRIALYKDTQQLLIDGVPTEIPNNQSLIIGDGRIYRESNIYTIVYPTGDQLVAKVLSSRINLSVFLTEARQGQIQGLLGNFNGNFQDDLAKRDGTVLSEPVTPAQLYGEYADSWRITQAESLFDYKPGETTTTFTLPNFPIRKVTLTDLNPADIAKAEERIGDSITDPTIREAAIIDYILTGFDDSIIEEAIASPTPEGILAIVVPPKAFEDFADTTNNIPVTLDVLSNDTGTLGVPLLLADFNPTTSNGGTINRNDNGTSNDLSDDVLTYTPPANFVGTDRFNYTLSDGTQIAAGTVTINVLEPIVIPLTAVEDIATTTTNTPVSLNVLSNDTGPLEVPLSIANFDPTTTNGGNISRNDNGTPNDLSDDGLNYTPPANFVGRDRFNYTLSDGMQTSVGNVTIAISATPTPLISELDLATLNGSNGFAINGINPGDFSGIAVSGIGDFNRDGFDDVAIGAFGADPNGINAAGETYLIYGSPAGFPANFNPSQLNGTNGFILNGIDAESFSGGSLSRAGDFNGDGFDDLMVGAFASSVNSQEDAGKTYILFGTNQSVPTRFDLSQLNGSNGFVLSGQDEFDYVGIAVNTAGDINADGFDDLLIAAPGSLGGESGKTYILYGGSQNIPTNLTLADLKDASEELLTFTRGFQQPISAAISRGHIVVSGINSQPSTSVNGVGDLNDDGFDDVAVAPEPNEDNPVSETYVLFGSASGFGNNLNLTELDSNNGFILTNLPPNANASLSRAGDVNDDGIDDLLLGVPEATVGDLPNVGKTYVVFGNKEGFGDRLDISQLDGSNGFVLNGSEADELAGSSVSAAGDINSDSIDDLIIGAAGATVNDLASAGKVYAVFGSETAFPASLNLAELDGGNGFVLNGANADDSTGISIGAAGDTNGDTIDDLIVGAPGNLFNNTPGKSYIIFGNPSYGIG